MHMYEYPCQSAVCVCVLCIVCLRVCFCICVYSLLFERRILMTSRRLCRLTACVHAAAALIYPLHWQVFYASAQRSVAEGITVLSCLSVRPCVCPEILLT